ncbi:hypothetical protein DFAR_2980018 [Desulfarculales bacterium]
MLRWIRKATSVRAAQWSITHFTRHALKCIAPDTKALAQVFKALMTLKKHALLILSPLDLQPFQHPPRGGLNGIFQVARARARGYRNVFTFMAMVYFIATPLGEFIKFHR